MTKAEEKAEARKALLEAGKKNFKPLVHNEFECPRCGGIASVAVENSIMRAECHRCSIWAETKV